MEKFKQPNGSLIVNGTLLEGASFQKYVKRHGLCDICGEYQTHEKHGRFLNKVLIPLTRRNEQGSYKVYKGFCIQPTCYTLEQAQRDLGEIPSKPKRVPRNHAFPPSNKMLESPGSNSTDRIFEGRFFLNNFNYIETDIDNMLTMLLESRIGKICQTVKRK